MPSILWVCLRKIKKKSFFTTLAFLKHGRYRKSTLVHCFSYDPSRWAVETSLLKVFRCGVRELFRHWTGHRSVMCRARRSGYYAWNVLASNANWRIQEINGQMNPLISSVVQGIDTNWFGRTRETMHNQATLTDRAAMRRYDRSPPALSMPVLADSRVQKRGQRPGICALPLLARWTGLVQRTNTCTSSTRFVKQVWILLVAL
jgi:hypothetical protein